MKAFEANAYRQTEYYKQLANKYGEDAAEAALGEDPELGGTVRRVRYARVPSGAETCAFCLMLASRGFKYRTQETASHAHSKCDCRIVPGFTAETKVEGYDEGGLYRRYLDCRAIVKDKITYEAWERLSEAEKAKYDSYNDFVMREIVKEMRRHDPEWVRDGVLTDKERELLLSLQDANPAMYADLVDRIIEDSEQMPQPLRDDTASMPTVKLSKQEYAHVQSEIRTNLSDSQKSMRVVSKAIGDHLYTFENNWPDDARIIGKVEIDDTTAGDVDEVRHGRKTD